MQVLSEFASADFGRGPGIPGLVSVIIPTFNRAGVIGRTLESVIGQTYDNIEVVVIDDGSSDSTREVVESYGPKVRYQYQKNAGVCAARNHGLAIARGEFVALLDSDDIWLPWKVEAQVSVLRARPDVGMVWTDMQAIGENEELIHERYLRRFYGAYGWVAIDHALQSAGTLGEHWAGAPAVARDASIWAGDLFAHMIMGNLVHTSTVLMRRSRLAQVGGFDERLKLAGEDYEFHLRTCSYGPVALLDVPSMQYRIGAADQLSNPRHELQIAQNNLTTVLRWIERGKDRIDLPREMLKERLAHAYGWVGEEQLQSGNHQAALRHLWHSLRFRPEQPRKAIFLLFALLPDSMFRRAQKTLRAARGLRHATRPGGRQPRG